MNKNYIFLMSLLILLAAGLLILPVENNSKELDPESLMWDIVQPTRYLTTDEVAKMIIEHDPLLMLVDVRNEDEYQAFSLSNALNIPLDSFAIPYVKNTLTVEDENIVFYSNDDLKADQAWVLGKRMGLNNIYVMKGGLNCWIQTIIQPQAPDQNASTAEFDLYTFRKGASMFFTGSEIQTNDNIQVDVKVTRKKKAKVAEGGC